MPRVTQECDFTIHEDAPSVCSSAEGSAEQEHDEFEESGAQESLDGGEDHLPADEELASGGVFQGDTDERLSYDHDEFDTPEDHGDQLASLEAEEANPDRESTSSSNSHRRTSGRTDALIHAAAKAVVAKIESRRNTPDLVRAGEEELDISILSHTTDGGGDYIDQANQSYADSAEAEDEASPRASDAASPPAPMADDGGGDSSSHNGADDDVFSDRSPRSSMGSLGSASSSDRGGKYSLDETLTQATRSPRISSISQYEDQDDGFVPTSRNTPRPPFRSPSSVKAMQMTSPPPSVYSSPRSSGRRMYPTISRLGSPVGSSAQYSPKGRSTPPRLKARKEAPLVLLHVTLLPPAWLWADVLEAASTEELGEATKGLRDAWRQLQSRVGDTVLERGVLLPHPQNDFEVLEERTLEALELPLRRRARILECGHYLGPSNEMTAEDSESEWEEGQQDDSGGRGSRGRAGVRSTHWCATCEHDIKYESLGPGRVFRVKVYASNGLMMAGAWEACWKEMERVDVEIEPFVDAAAQEELTRLATEQQMREDEAYMQDNTAHELGGGHDMEDGQGDGWGEQGGGIMTDQDRSLLSPTQQHPVPTTSSPNPPENHMQDPGTTVINRGSAHLVPTTPARDMQVEERSHSVASHHHAHSPRPDTTLDDDRALLGRPPPRLLNSAPNTDRSVEQRSHSSLSHRSPLPPASDPTARMRIEESGHSSSADHRSQPHIPSSLAEEPLRIEQHPDDVNDTSFPSMPDVGVDEDRRRRDEERLREIYGHTPPQAPRSPSPSPRHHHEHPYAPPAPPSPSQQAYERREERRKAYQAASLPELLLEAVKVFFRDTRNVVILLLGALALGLAVRGGGAGGYEMEGWRVSKVGPSSGHAGAEARVADTRVVTEAAQEAGPLCGTPGVEAERPGLVEPERLVEREVVRVVETITETIKVTATTTESEAEAETQVESPGEKLPADEDETRVQSDQPESEADGTMDEDDTSGDDTAKEPLTDPVLHEEL